MKTINEDIKSGQFRPAYLLYGEEAYLKVQYKNKLLAAILPEDDTMNLSVYTGKGIDVKQVIDQAETMPFFADHRLILIEDSGFFKNATPELAEYLPQMPQETILIFVESEVDKRGKLYKKVKDCGRVVEMKRQDERTLTAWVLGMVKRDGKRITQDAMSLFLQKTGDDMENIAHELEKLLSYTLDADAITPADVEAVCTETTENQIFEMIRAVAEKQQRQALDLYYDLLSLKEPPMRILFLIARQFNQMLQLKDLREQGMDNNTVASKAGLAPFIAKKTLSQAAHFSKEALRQAVEDCVEAEEAVKTGRLNDRLAVELLIVKFSENAA
ncbi:MAG: DNA polymerase III subunit delta [Lachnospiraceae bacterium]|nr:DNA polymerase III subunit delta [Lachnospiraceae bacterium]